MTNTTFAPTLLNTTLSNGNLTVAHSNTTTGGARSADFQSSGKYYFEVTLTTITGSNTSLGILQGWYGATDFVNAAAAAAAALYKSGAIWGNGSNSGFSLGALANGDVIGVAVDLDNAKIWFRKAPSGNWDGNATHDPATTTGGASISSLVGGASPVAVFSGIGTGATETMTANFGQSSFSGTVPSGFTSGWPGPASTAAAVARAGLHGIEQGISA